MLRFLIEQVGEVENAYPGEARLAEDFLVRRAAGNGLELIGILTFRASPVWVLAALADLSGAGRELIREISGTLKQQGLLDPATQFETMDQLLDGLEAASGRLAEAINTPPLDVEGLRGEWAAVRAGAKKLPALPDAARLRESWSAVEREAAAQGRSPFELSTLMALSAIQNLPKNLVWLSQCSSVAARGTGKFFAASLLDHYETALGEVRRKGFVPHWRDQFRPYLRSAAAQFSPSRKSLTERWLDSR
ncbi:MAG: hypothetical protein ACRD96_19600 [Bryobacteraceae bacterium]